MNETENSHWAREERKIKRNKEKNVEHSENAVVAC